MTPSEVSQQIEKEGCSVDVYFKRAMRWKYHQDHDTYLDVLKFQVHYMVADYVKAYTLHLQQAAIRRAEDESCADDLYPVLLTRGD